MSNLTDSEAEAAGLSAPSLLSQPPKNLLGCEQGSDPPRYLWAAPVYFDDLDAMGMLHNAGYLLLIERANSAFFEGQGWRFEKNPARNPDQHYVVREQTIRYLEPITGPGTVAVEMWVKDLGRTSVTFAFEIRSGDLSRCHARAERTHVKLDPATLRPAPWTRLLRQQLATLVRRAQ